MTISKAGLSGKRLSAPLMEHECTGPSLAGRETRPGEKPLLKVSCTAGTAPLSWAVVLWWQQNLNSYFCSGQAKDGFIYTHTYIYFTNACLGQFRAVYEQGEWRQGEKHVKEELMTYGVPPPGKTQPRRGAQRGCSCWPTSGASLTRPRFAGITQDGLQIHRVCGICEEWV